MRHLVRTYAGRHFLPPFSALLWGAVEFLALARSRWSLRARRSPQA